ncbi:hypothetical protein Peur_003146 [Populus x canadensis]
MSTNSLSYLEESFASSARQDCFRKLTVLCLHCSTCIKVRLQVVSTALQFLWGRSPTILTTNDLNSIPLVKKKKKSVLQRTKL